MGSETFDGETSGELATETVEIVVGCQTINVKATEGRSFEDRSAYALNGFARESVRDNWGR